eukprot:TRINITY_DN190_c0_g2_i1.p1 TRINITY_DN190_c0_g2~~TRINITY_DN190_c0_g2_i1.p1  ORF type:complete len:601 (-),score=191.27 TRINITY_DN190_c0_g2_i1:171-1973(-)
MSSSSSSSPKNKNRWILKKTASIWSSYKQIKQLGLPGQFGYCVLAEFRSDKSQRRAVKVINKSKFALCTTGQQKHLQKMFYESLRNEIEVMQKMDHPHIIKLYEYFEDEEALYLVLEPMYGGELFDRIKAMGTFSEKDAAQVLRQVMVGIKYMHEQKIAHCDLKPDNLLFLSKDRDSIIKIIDFGMSKFVQRRQYFDKFCGTAYYVAPEVLALHYSEHCDIWSMGVIMFVMLFGYPPFHSDPQNSVMDDNEQIYAQIKNGFTPEVKEGVGAWFPTAIPCSTSAQDLMSKMLIYDPSKRITAAEALEHPWLKGETADTAPRVDKVLQNLIQFSNHHAFKQAVCQLMSDYVSDQELTELKRVFREIDTNSDGKISISELKDALKKWSPVESKEEKNSSSSSSTDTTSTSTSTSTSSSDEKEQKYKEEDANRLLQLIHAADVNGDGAISWNELTITSVQRKLCAKEERLYEAFCKLDLDFDGKITKSEIERVLGKDAAPEIMLEADKNHDGIIDYDEFLAIWENKQDSTTATTTTSSSSSSSTSSSSSSSASSLSSSSSTTTSSTAFSSSSSSNNSIAPAVLSNDSTISQSNSDASSSCCALC